jgi:hypothetical protein
MKLMNFAFCVTGLILDGHQCEINESFGIRDVNVIVTDFNGRAIVMC